jgi:hypothetical protein
VWAADEPRWGAQFQFRALGVVEVGSRGQGCPKGRLDGTAERLVGWPGNGEFNIPLAVTSVLTLRHELEDPLADLPASGGPPAALPAAPGEQSGMGVLHGVSNGGVTGSNEYVTLDGLRFPSVLKRDKGVSFVMSLTPWVRLSGLVAVKGALGDGTWEDSPRGDPVQRYFVERARGQGVWAGGGESVFPSEEVARLAGVPVWRQRALFKAFMLSNWTHTEHPFSLEQFSALGPACDRWGTAGHWTISMEGRQWVAHCLEGYALFETLVRAPAVGEALAPLVLDLRKFRSSRQYSANVIVLAMVEDLLGTWHSALRALKTVGDHNLAGVEGCVGYLKQLVENFLNSSVQEGGPLSRYTQAAFFAEGGGLSGRAPRRVPGHMQAGGGGRVVQKGVKGGKGICLLQVGALAGVKDAAGKCLRCPDRGRCVFSHVSNLRAVTSSMIRMALAGGSVTAGVRSQFEALAREKGDRGGKAPGVGNVQVSGSRVERTVG